MERMMHGGDYNPDQWLDRPDILEEDSRLMKLAKVNEASIGIFAWTALEPEEGRFEFGWLDDTFERLEKGGVSIILATPSGARPRWLSARYPEVLRVGADRRRAIFGERHNHCYTSPLYREKVRIIDTKLAERYGTRSSLVMWHLSNEYGGECHCPLCQEAFRAWLKNRYEGDLDALNRAWNAAFWSHLYTSWDQVESPSPLGDEWFLGLSLDWKRFVTWQTTEFMKTEIAAIRTAGSAAPVTTNLMLYYPGLDYFRLAEPLDLVSWDSYPQWHGSGPRYAPNAAWVPDGKDWRLASGIALFHDLMRCLKPGKPFHLMESTPSMTNWQPVAKLKRPGMHLLSSLQAVAHGSDSVMYFQWRKGPAGSEKLHGAVVDHEGTENNRVFREVAETGSMLEKLSRIVGSGVKAEVALIYDWENRWAYEASKGPRNDGLVEYDQVCRDHYCSFWRQGIPVDVIDETRDIAGYRLVVAPLIYLLKPGFAKRVADFVKSGGSFVATYWSGIVDESDRCFLGGFPGDGLREVLGIRAEEIDALYPAERNLLAMSPGNEVGLMGAFEASLLCDLIHAEKARVLATYGRDFYAGRPALTVNDFGRGKAYYIAAHTGEDFLNPFYGNLASKLSLARALDADLPEGVSAMVRTDGNKDFVFVMNFGTDSALVHLKGSFTDEVSGAMVRGTLDLPGYGIRVLERPAKG
jgi:beta-galactosidase